MDSSFDGGRVRQGEWPALFVSFAYFFCVLTAYYVIRPLRDQLTGAVGSTQLPWFYGVNFVATLLLTPLFAWLVARYARRVMVPAVYGFFIACLLAFVPFFADESLVSPRTLGITFYVWVSVFNLFVVSVFWIFMSDVWDPAQSRRLFPLIAFAGTAGALTGPLVTTALVTVIGVAPLLVVSAVLLVLATACSMLLGRWTRDPMHPPHRASGAPVGGGMFDGLKQVVTSPFMRTMALLLILADGIGGVNYAALVDYSRATFETAEQRTLFAARVDLFANVLTMALQLCVTWWLLPRFGAGRLILIWAIISMVSLGSVVFFADPYAPVLAGLPIVAIAAFVSRGLAFGMAEPARHSLFTQVPREERFKGQNAVDTTVWRFGDLLVALLMNAGRSAGVGIAGFAAFGAGAAAAAAAIGWRLSLRRARLPA